ncbi:hypothetical protein [Microbacterium lacus]|uniref:LPXTG cell wall anchor domain-containing protein n=1 Tax=Microbacterium lacus TaxID=415217 RepID=A0ABN2G727_9MICO
MRTPLAAGIAAACLISISILAVPAVASGSEYLAYARSASNTTTVAGVVEASQNTDVSDASTAALRENAGGLSPLITAWGFTGLALFGGGAIAVATSVRKQRKLAV